MANIADDQSGGTVVVVPTKPTSSTNTSPDAGGVPGVPAIPPIGGGGSIVSPGGGTTITPVTSPDSGGIPGIPAIPPTGGGGSIVAPGGGITYIPPVATSNQSTINPVVVDYNNRVDNFNKSVDNYTTKVDSFNAKWAPLINGDTFTGTEAEFKEYKKEANKLDIERINLSTVEQSLKQKGKALDLQRSRELANYVQIGKDEYILKSEYDKLDPKYQTILRDQGFNALNSRIDADNKEIIHQALVDSMEQYKNPDGTYDLVKAVKWGLSEKTLTIAFGADRAKAAIEAAGPPPKGGWGRAAPTLPQAIGVVTSETLFPPAKQWVEPELHYKATGMDWAIGGAQIALFALPLVGVAGRAAMVAAEGTEGAARAAMATRLVSGGIQTGAAAIFTTDTVLNFNELKKNPWQLALAIGMDALVAHGAFRTLAPKRVSAISSKIVDVARTEKGGTIPGTTAASEDLRNTLNKLPDAISEGDSAKIRDVGQRLKQWAETHPDNPASKVLDRRADDFIKNAGDYAKLRDVKTPATEGPIPTEVLEARDHGLIGNEKTLNNLDDFLKSKEIPPVEPENPLSKQSIESRLKAKGDIESKAKSIADAQNEVKAKYDAETREKAFAEEIAKLKADAEANPLSRQSVRERLKAKALADAKIKALTDTHEKMKARVEAEKVAKTFEDELAKAKAEAQANPLSRLSVRERLKLKANLEAKAKAVVDSRNSLKAAYDAEKFAQSEVDKIMKLKATAMENPLSKYNIKEKLSTKNIIDREIQARADAIKKMKARVDAEKSLESYGKELAKAKAEAQANPLSRLSVREKLRIKANLEAKIKAVEEAQAKLKVAYDSEIQAKAFSDEMQALKAKAAENPTSRQSVRESLRLKKNLEAQQKALLEAQEKLKAKVDAEVSDKTASDLQKRIDEMARTEAQKRLGEKKPSTKEPSVKSGWTPEDEANLRALEQKGGKGGLEGEDLIDYERLRDKYRQTEGDKVNPNPEEPKPEDHGGGTKTAVKEKTEIKTETKTETKTKVETDAEKILKEKQGTEEKVKTEEETKTKSDTKVKPKESTGSKTSAGFEPRPRTDINPSAESGSELESVTSTRINPTTKPLDITKVKPTIIVRPNEADYVNPDENPKDKPIGEPKQFTQPDMKPIDKIKTNELTDLKPVNPPEFKPLEKYKPTTMHPTKITTDTKIRRRHGSGMTDQEKRDIIANPDNTAFTWQQGKLHGEPVHHVGIIDKAGNVEQTTVLGAKPDGAISAEGKGQSYKSITLTHGNPPKGTVKLEGGAVDPVVSPISGKRGVTIRFVPDEENKPRKERKPKGGRFNPGKTVDLGADIVRSRRGRHLRVW